MAAGRRNGWLVVPAVVLVLCAAGSLATRGAMGNLQFLRKNGGAGGTGEIVDQQPLQTAQALYPVAVSAEEQQFASEAVRQADHEVDQAFAQALRQAAAESRSLTGKALAAQGKVSALQATVKADQAAVDALAGKTPTAASGKAEPSGAAVGEQNDDLDVAKTQLALDKDELTDAQNVLAAVSGDKRAKIQEELAAHEAGMKKYDDHTAAGSETGQVAVISSKRYGTLAGRVKAWFDQRGRMGLLEQAKSKADADTSSLTAERAGLQGKASVAASQEAAGVSEGDAAVAPNGGSSRLADLRKLEAQKNIQAILNDRIEGQKELSANYAKWLAQVQLQHRIVVHLLLNSLTWVALIVLCAAAAAQVGRRIIERRMVGIGVPERRSLQTMQTVVQFGIEAVGLVLVLLVVFGAPKEVPTILGLATAGLTVVFQDHILAFFGWFVLMARNGIRVGDWVEIAGVGGEVVEVGLLRTTLLETGNWTDKGHPTGRRISFVNKFAMSGQYFNFSTDGQWMWDEITVNLPANDDVFALVERMRESLAGETANDTAVAESEWQRATQRHGLSQFSAKPTVEMRAAAAGVDVVVRYVTRAAERLEMRNRLSQAIIRLLHVPGSATAALEAAS